ncbi:hypothetical protein DdX_16061 [Ditylenchus destructor]|uniref:Uncharacterized protein n=1 Tax=Ditylenchus destructor TaxID=166010 RepID=A0AAD4MR36_9BILA|nr:hypothetical protein DdX_16061 [Ditylenchus destructor]
MSSTWNDLKSETTKSVQENKACLKIETVAQCSNYEYTHEHSTYDFEETPQDQKMPRCTVSLNPASENDENIATEGDDDEADDVAVADDPEDDLEFKNFGAFVTKTLKRLSTSFDQSMAKRARTNIKDMLFRVEFVRMRSDYASV